MITALLLAMTLPAKAQMTDNGYANVDWQYNFPTGKAFAGGSSGWGVNAEGGYYLNKHWGVGLFMNWHSNHEYIPRTVLSLSPSESLSTDQQHTAFRLPFGVAGRYAWNRGGDFQPYIAIKAGAQYAKLTSDFNVFEDRDKTWGFYVSPEIGLHIFPYTVRTYPKVLKQWLQAVSRSYSAFTVRPQYEVCPPCLIAVPHERIQGIERCHPSYDRLRIRETLYALMLSAYPLQIRHYIRSVL